MHITVGSSHDPSGGPSKVEVGGEVVLEAAPGGSTTELRPDDGGDGYSGGGGSQEPWEEAMVVTERMDLLEEQEDEVLALMWEHLAVKSFLLCPEREV